MCRHTTPPACYLKYLHEGHDKGSLQGSLKNKDMVLLHMYLSMKNWDAVSACAAHSDWTGVTYPYPRLPLLECVQCIVCVRIHRVGETTRNGCEYRSTGWCALWRSERSFEYLLSSQRLRAEVKCR